MEYGVHSLITVPLRSGTLVLGVVSFWRSEKPEPFDEDEMTLAEELVARAAVSIDNARRYTREHSMAVTLQRSLLPRRMPEQNALDIAYRYLPAQAGVGGDWFDVLPLSGARVALVVGDIVGHGLHAGAATMGAAADGGAQLHRPRPAARRAARSAGRAGPAASTRTRRPTTAPPRSPARPASTLSTTRSPAPA